MKNNEFSFEKIIQRFRRLIARHGMKRRNILLLLLSWLLLLILLLLLLLHRRKRSEKCLLS